MKDGFKNVENGLYAQVEEDGGRRIWLRYVICDLYFMRMTRHKSSKVKCVHVALNCNFFLFY